jgi:hypothetical protein
MRRLTRTATAIAIAIALGFSLTSCGGDPAPGAAPGHETRKVTAGAVEVTITPTSFNDDGATFAIVLDTHSVDLDLDVAASASLNVGGRSWTIPTWVGAGPGGHHREGTLAFTASGPPAGEAVLTINGLDQPAVARWTLPQGS